MKSQLRLASGAFLLLCLMMAATALSLAQRGQQRDALGFLKRELTEAGAPALTSEQETQLKTLISNFRSAQPTGPDEALKAAHTAYSAALLAGDLTAAQAQATIIAGRTSELSNARLQATTKFQIEAVAVLKGGGQLDALRQKLGDEHVVGLIGSLAGGPPFGSPIFGGPPGGRPGGGPGFGPQPRPGVDGRD
jgi:hypothetical protein